MQHCGFSKGAFAFHARSQLPLGCDFISVSVWPDTMVGQGKQCVPWHVHGPSLIMHLTRIELTPRVCLLLLETGKTCNKEDLLVLGSGSSHWVAAM